MISPIRHIVNPGYRDPGICAIRPTMPNSRRTIDNVIAGMLLARPYAHIMVGVGYCRDRCRYRLYSIGAIDTEAYANAH
jgi:hypothetical protein